MKSQQKSRLTQIAETITVLKYVGKQVLWVLLMKIYIDTEADLLSSATFALESRLLK